MLMAVIFWGLQIVARRPGTTGTNETTSTNSSMNPAALSEVQRRSHRRAHSWRQLSGSYHERRWLNFR
jgi:hypothetical protein